MLRILVRSKRDADAVRASLARFPETSDMEVVSLGGVRGERIVDRVEELLEPFTIVILGREDAAIAPRLREALRRVPFTALVESRTKRVRNNTIEMINALITRGRAEIRLTTYWNDTYILSNSRSGVRVPVPVEPYADTFFLFGSGARLALDIMGLEYSGSPPLLLAVKLAMGEHLVYAGPQRLGGFRANNRGLRPRGWSEPGVELAGLSGSIEGVARDNSRILTLLEEHSLRVFEKTGDVDTVIVPLSGGKDSASALILATRYYGPERVKAVYVDTGIDFFENEEEARKVAETVGVELHVARAGVDRGLLAERMPLPDPKNRWCTGRKLEALRKTISRIARGRTVIVVGDRDAESDRRSRRPSIRPDEKLPYPTVAPMKFWSGAHVEAFLAYHGVPLNPLYELGFYRTGCYICFSLRDWELEAMRRGGVFDRITRERPEHEKLIRAFLESRGKGPGGG